jgi:hypothetical protein
MTLPRDTARCLGHWHPVPFGRTLESTCTSCQRRICSGDSKRQPWTQGVVVDGVCEQKLTEES